jgi:hypothetical protein
MDSKDVLLWIVKMYYYGWYRCIIMDGKDVLLWIVKMYYYG